jgi:hypothetical protein
LFVKDYVNISNEDDEQEVYRRYEEEHIERGYSIVDIKQAAEEAGLHVLSITDGYTGDPLRPDSVRAVFTVHSPVHLEKKANIG